MNKTRSKTGNFFMIIEVLGYKIYICFVENFRPSRHLSIP
jgi:hypothetical protein